MPLPFPRYSPAWIASCLSFTGKRPSTDSPPLASLYVGIQRNIYLPLLLALFLAAVSWAFGKEPEEAPQAGGSRLEEALRCLEQDSQYKKDPGQTRGLVRALFQAPSREAFRGLLEAAGILPSSALRFTVRPGRCGVQSLADMEHSQSFITREVAAAIAAFFLNNSEATVRKSGIEAIATLSWADDGKSTLFKSKRYSQAAVSLLVDKSAEVREAAAWALMYLGDKSDRALAPELATCLSDLDLEVRKQALWSLGLYGNESFARVVAERLEDPAAEVREAALLALLRFHAKPFASQVARLLVDKSPALRWRALSALKELGDSSFNEKVALLLEDPDPRVRGAAAAALGAHAGKAFVDRIGGLLGQESPQEVLVPALIALGELDGKSHLARIAGFLDSSDINVRIPAALTLEKLSGEKWTFDREKPWLAVELARAWWQRR